MIKQHFQMLCYLIIQLPCEGYTILAFPADIGRKPASPARGHRQRVHAGKENWLCRWRVHAG